MIVPHKVTSRDKRDDARIIDDRDSRNERYYSTATAVDIDPAAIKESWRHSGATFGVDHVREAVIRRFNLGPAKLSRRPDTFFAGTEVTITPFVLCPLCGGATDHEPGTSPYRRSCPSHSPGVRSWPTTVPGVPRGAAAGPSSRRTGA